MSNDYTTILIGNGLGMAVDHEYFKLQTGLDFAYKKLDKNQREIISLLKDKIETTSIEDSLKNHYNTMRAIILLTDIEKKTKKSWLSPYAVTFQKYFTQFILESSYHFFTYPTPFTENPNLHKLEIFREKLTDFIQYNNVHIVTLNYDRLIYEHIVNSDELKQKITDGFNPKDGGFKKEILSRYFGDRGYYLHLHGSPLFYTDLNNDIINKDNYLSININNEKYLREHLILCDTSQKPTQITSSKLLKSYWFFYKKALSQSNKIIIFGYSGNDPHVNSVLIEHLSNKEIIIVEYDGLDNDESRRMFWAEKLSLPNTYFNNQNLIRLDSILNYFFN